MKESVTTRKEASLGPPKEDEGSQWHCAYSTVPQVRKTCGVILPLWWLVMVAATAVGAAASAEERYVTTTAFTAATPYGLHIHSATGSILFTQRHNMQRIHANGTVEAVAGSGSTGTSNGIGVAASFNLPWGIGRGVRNPNVAYVADTLNHCLRHVDLATRNVTTFAGSCGATAHGYSDGIGAAARFNQPAGMVLFYNTSTDMDVFLYVADYNNHVIRRVEIATGNVTRFAGRAGSLGSANGPRTATALFNNPQDVTVDATGHWLYVADVANNCIRTVDVSNDMVATLAGRCGNTTNGLADGVGDAARLEYPRCLTIVSDGSTLYVSDTGNCAIRRISITDGNVTTVSGQLGCGLADGPLATARFNFPLGIQHRLRAVRTSNGRVVEEVLVIADRFNNAIRHVALTRSGTLSSTASPPLVSTTQSTSRASLSGTGSTASTTASNTPLALNATVADASQSGVATTSTPWTHSPSSSASASTTWPDPTASSSALAMSRSASHPMASATASNTASTTVSSSDASAPWSVSLSATVSDSSWSCGAYDPRNVSLAGVAPSPTVEAASLGRRMLSVAAVDVKGLTDPTDAVQQPVQLSGAPLPRVALLTTHREETPLLLLGLSLRWAGTARWNVVSAVSVRHGGEALMFNATTMTSPPESLGSTLGSAFHDIAVLLWPPRSSPNGWVAVGLEPVYTATEVAVELGLACAAEGGNISGGRAATVRVVIPAPGHPRELAEKVETVTTATQWTTAVGGPGAGSSVGRVGAVRSIALCGDGAGTSGGGLVGLRLGCGDGPAAGAHDNVVRSAARGAIVGNAGILCGSMVLLVLLAVLYSRATRVSFESAALRLAAPSVLLPVWIATLPSTSAGTMELLLSDRSSLTDCAWDAAVAVLGLLVCAAPLAWICFVWLRLVRLLGLHLVETPTARALSPGGRFGWLRGAVGDALRPRTRWVHHEAPTKTPKAAGCSTSESERKTALSTASTTASYADAVRVPAADEDIPRLDRARQAQVLLHEFHVLWYAALDAGVLVATGVLSASSGAGSHSLCVGAAASVCALYAVQLAVCAVSRPFTTRFALVHALMTLALSATSVGLQTVGIAEASSGDNGAASLERREMLSMASAVCDLFVIGISAVRVVFDVIEGCRAVGSIAKEVRYAHSVTRPPGSKDSSPLPVAAPVTRAPPAVVPAADAAAGVPQEEDASVLPLDTLLEPVLLGTDEGDLLFWDAAGNAVLPQGADSDGLLTVASTAGGGASANEALLGLPPLPLCIDEGEDCHSRQTQSTPSNDGSDEAAAYEALQLSSTQLDAVEL